MYFCSGGQLQGAPCRELRFYICSTDARWASVWRDDFLFFMIAGTRHQTQALLRQKIRLWKEHVGTEYITR